MHYYQELTLIKDSEISPYFIWSKLYTQLHLAFVEQKDANEQVPYGVSFPEYIITEAKGKQLTLLGSKLRVFADSAQALTQLNLDKWLERLTDYVHIKSAKPVETAKQYLVVNRYRPKPEIEKVAERFARHKGISFQEALLHCQQHKKGWEDYPYIQLKSLSGDHEFSLCVKQTVVEQAVHGKFSTYGLSGKSTVPHW